MKLSDLTNNQVVKYRIGFAGRTKVDWQEWKTGPIYVARRVTPYKSFPVGQLLTMTPINDNWAEYGERDYSNGTFTAEDYYMEIEGLTN